MAGRIPDHFIEDLLSRVDLVELIDRHVPLKRAGKNYTCCCPFHQEKSPSFTVSPEKQFYYCFGCGASGNAVSFLMDYGHLSFVEAIESIAKNLGIEVPREGDDKPKGPDRRPLYDILEKAREHYSAQLKNPRVRERAGIYLRKRGLSADIIERFGLGFAPPGWDNLTAQLGKDAKGLDLLQQTGMAIRSEQGRVYDRFRDRVMFPIRDGKGRTVAFGGRVLGDEKPKYLNSPETPVFHKGETLYGFYEARLATSKLDRFLVVEGYMDVIALAQHGISFAVATLGTACTREHVEALFRVVPEVVFCFDGDRAGRSAAWRALENALPAMREGRSVKFHFLPDGEDPDTQVRKDGPELFLANLNKALPLPEYLFEHLQTQVDMATLDGRAKLVSLALPLIDRLPVGVLQELMFERLAELSRLEKGRLRHIASLAAPAAGSGSAVATAPNPAGTPVKVQAGVSPQPHAERSRHDERPPAAGGPPEGEHPPWLVEDIPPFGAEDYDDGLPFSAPPDRNSTQSSPAKAAGHSQPSRRQQENQGPWHYEEETPPAWGQAALTKKKRFDPRDRRNFAPRKVMPPAPVTSLVDATIRSLLTRPEQAGDTDVPEAVQALDLPHLRLLLELMEYLRQHPRASMAALLGRWHASEEGEHLAALAASEFLQSSGPLHNELGDALRKLHLISVEQELDALIKANIPNPTRFRELLHLKQELSRVKH